MKPFCISGLLVAMLACSNSWAEPEDANGGTQARAVATTYAVHDLGSVQGGASYARAVNGRGRAAGYAVFNVSGGMRPALFELGKLPLPIYTDGPGEANGLNDDDEVVGYYMRGDSKQAFLWRQHELRLLLSPIGGQSEASAINNRSEVVGWFEVAPGVKHGFYYHKGQLVDLGSWGGISSQATGINKKGDIVGFRVVVVNGVVVTQGVLMLQGQKPRLIRPPAGFDNLLPNSINEGGEVAGKAWSSSRRFDFETSAFATRDGQAVDLQRPGCCFGTAGVALNKKGVVVGYNFDRNGDPHENLTLWHPRQGQVGLSGLGRDQGWYQLTEGNDISNDGVIVGAGVQWPRDFFPHALMLVPHRP